MIRAVKRSGLTTFCHKIKSSLRWILKRISTKNVWIFMIFTNRPEMVKIEVKNRPERSSKKSGLTTFYHKIKSSLRWILKRISTKKISISAIFTRAYISGEILSRCTFGETNRLISLIKMFQLVLSRFYLRCALPR